MYSECGSTIMEKKPDIDNVRVSPLEDKTAVQTIGDSFDSFFNFKYQNDCKDEIACTLLAAGCKSPYSGNLETKKDPVTKNWPLTTKPGLTAPLWKETLCVRCQATASAGLHDNFHVSSTKCGAVLVNTPNHFDSKEISFSEQSQEIVTDAASFWENKGDDSCKIEKCTLKASGCTDAYSGGKLKMSTAAPFKVESLTSKEAFVETVCI